MIGHLAVVGATGAVGREVCQLLVERRIRFERLSLYASARSAGQPIEVDGRNYVVKELGPHSFHGADFAIFSAGAKRSEIWAPVARDAGCVVIDNSSAFRMRDEVPLVVPEINPDDLKGHQGIIANPNCTAIVVDVVVWPLHRVNRVERMVVSSYQAASGAGAAGLEELRTQTADVLAGRPPVPKVFPHPIAFNVFSHNTPMGPDGYNQEEEKVIAETRKMFHEPDLPITVTCIRVPVLRAHSASVNLTFERPIHPDEVRAVLSKAPGVEVVDDVERGRFPMPVDASGKDDVLVGRIRRDFSRPDGRGINLFVCGDQLRKGAALNAVQILERLTE